jgi:hypothetical protein
MVLTSLLAGKLVLGKMTGSKVASISFLTSSISDAIMGTITYHYWDGKKKKSSFTVKKHKRRW